MNGKMRKMATSYHQPDIVYIQSISYVHQALAVAASISCHQNLFMKKATYSTPTDRTVMNYFSIYLGSVNLLDLFEKKMNTD